ncbi:hypothetical protein FQR65_LT04850 [Abscondita terminalis]|nr:hypothetical protein FQR65_LT04850 [Abscondita terminalis]
MAGAVSADFFQTGCNHYKRKCQLLAPCCNNLYPCHICHDEAEKHRLNRFKILNHMCVNCKELQEVNVRCLKCGIPFGEYACVLCYMFDDNNKKQFHCADCGICRVGGGGNFFHCKKCNMCLGLHLKNNHKCVEDCGNGDCPLCAEFLKTSRIELHVPKCGHLIHKSCYEQLINEQFDYCPVCKAKYC